CRIPGRIPAGTPGVKEIHSWREDESTLARGTSLDVEELARVQNRVTQLDKGLLLGGARRQFGRTKDSGLSLQQVGTDFFLIRTGQTRESQAKSQTNCSFFRHPTFVHQTGDAFRQVRCLLDHEVIVEHGQRLQRHSGSIAACTVESDERLVEYAQEGQVI